MNAKAKSDFSTGSVYRHILSLAVPMTIAQLVQLVYNMVDRIYIGHLPGESYLALTGLGLTFPIVTIVMAVTNLFGVGGAPLFSIARGRKDEAQAQRIMGNAFLMLCVCSFAVMILCLVFMKPVLYMFGASDDSYPYAAAYLRIYLIGTPFIMITSGMNGFINAQGFGKTGMVTVTLGAIINIFLDPLFIFVMDLGVRGAALATVLSQAISAAWVLLFLLGKRALIRINWSSMRPDGKILVEMTKLGMAGFIMSASNGVVQVACNATLRGVGGDLYVGIMTVLNSVRELFFLPMTGITHAAQPVMGYNYGATLYDRVKKSIRFTTITTVTYMIAAWLVVFLFPGPIMGIFSSDASLIAAGIPCMHVYYFGMFFMAFMMTGQSTFVGLGMSKHSIFFSLLRKVIVVVPLTILLPKIPALGVMGVFLAEPISNVIGAMGSYLTMLHVTGRVFRQKEAENG